jgi:L-alanine-DL-glutamate epimerase-like enolase superfamily enzyme
LVEPLDLGPEVARAPDRPGLGVELDLNKVDRFRER